MPAREIMPAERLARIQQIYPGAISYGQVEGIRNRLLPEVRKMEKRGEIKALMRFARRDDRTGQVTIPYVRYKTASRVRYEQAARIGAVAGVGLLAAVGAGWLIWESRFVIMAAVGLALLLTGSVLIGGPHWTRGCPGLHCSGCQE